MSSEGNRFADTDERSSGSEKSKARTRSEGDTAFAERDRSGQADASTQRNERKAEKEGTRNESRKSESKSRSDARRGNDSTSNPRSESARDSKETRESRSRSKDDTAFAERDRTSQADASAQGRERAGEKEETRSESRRSESKSRSDARRGNDSTSSPRSESTRDSKETRDYDSNTESREPIARTRSEGDNAFAERDRASNSSSDSARDSRESRDTKSRARSESNKGQKSRACEPCGAGDSNFAERGRDDFMQIEGIDADAEAALRRAGYQYFTDLESADPKTLKEDLADCGCRLSAADCESWIEQSSDVVRDASGSQYQGKRDGRPVGFSASGSQWADDLTRIRGIGSNLASALRDAGIQSFQQLKQAKTSFLQKLASETGSNSVDPSTWSKQAEFAAKGDWSGLDRWNSKNQSEAGEATASKRRTSTGTTSESDDLTRINGIGPATQRFLQSQGVTRFEQIALMTGRDLLDMLESEARFKLVEPDAWPRRAKEILADDFDVPMSMLDDVNAIANLRGQEEETTEPDFERSR